MNLWLHGWLAGGPRWSWGGCRQCWVLLQNAWRAVVCPVQKATWPGSRASYLLSSWVLFDVCVAGYSFPNEWISLVRMGSFYSGRLLSSLLCHWLVGRTGRRGFLKVVPLARGVFFVRGSRQRRREWDSGLLWWLSYRWLGRYVLIGVRTEEGELWGEMGLNRRRWNDMWVSPHNITELLILWILMMMMMMVTMMTVRNGDSIYFTLLQNQWQHCQKFPLMQQLIEFVQFEVFLVEKINILFVWVCFTLDAGRWVLMFLWNAGTCPPNNMASYSIRIILFLHALKLFPVVWQPRHLLDHKHSLCLLSDNIWHYVLT